MNFLQQLDMFFSVANGLVFAVVCLLVLVVIELRKSTITHYQRTDMVDMSLSANEYMVHLKNGDIRGEWKPVFNGKFLPLDAGVMEAHLAAKAECELKDMLTEAYAMNDDVDFERALRDEADAHYAGTVVNVVGYCLCKTEMGSFKPFKFTTVKSSAEDTKFLDMIACSHCPVCNPEMDKMLAD